MREINLLGSFPKSKTRERIIQLGLRTEENKKIAKLYGKEYFDGDRINGYGGMRYDARWRTFVPKLQELYGINSNTSILDIGCAKGFLLYDLQEMIPGIRVAGIDISEYAVNHAMMTFKDYKISQGIEPETAEKLEEEARKKVLPHMTIGSADNLPWPDNSFDVVLAINTIHNLPREKCKKALQEMIRVGRDKKNMYLTVDSYKTREDKERMDKWILTAETVMPPDEWLDFFKEAGYGGDYSWFIA